MVSEKRGRGVSGRASTPCALLGPMQQSLSAPVEFCVRRRPATAAPQLWCEVSTHARRGLAVAAPLRCCQCHGRRRAAVGARGGRLFCVRPAIVLECGASFQVCVSWERRRAVTAMPMPNVNVLKREPLWARPRVPIAFKSGQHDEMEPALAFRLVYW